MLTLASFQFVASFYRYSPADFFSRPLYGKLSDIFGRKACLLSAYTIFGLGCLFCGLARTMDELIYARAFAGIGGGGMTTYIPPTVWLDTSPSPAL
jgi:MFS family permease